MMSFRTLFLGGAVALSSLLFALPLQAGGWCDDGDDEAANLHVAVFTDGYLHAAVFADGYLRSGGLSDCEDEGDGDGDGTDEIPEIVVTAPPPAPSEIMVQMPNTNVYTPLYNGMILDYEEAAPYVEAGCEAAIDGAIYAAEFAAEEVVGKKGPVAEAIVDIAFELISEAELADAACDRYNP